MKKILTSLLFTLLLPINLDARLKKGTPEWQEWVDSLRTIEQMKYRHPEPKTPGDKMPLVRGNYVSYLSMDAINKATNEKREIGKIYGYDADGDKKPEYEFLVRDCDKERKNKIVAAYDVHNKKLYIDYDRNLKIDEVVDYDTLEEILLPEIPTKCDD